ncbi:glycosyltransferase [Sorangium sp. So ce321]|uniref:glycosyltransferase n=1 Tax=Sorangium sp. So ce321 TaxID=3133300 RepID=UPI003F5F3BAE
MRRPICAVFAESPAHRARAGRTLRALRLAGLAPVDVTAAPLGAAAEVLAAGPVWLVRGGAWPFPSAALDPDPFPPPSDTGLPLCALGAVMAPPDPSARAEPDAVAWVELLRATGGELSRAARARRGPGLPRAASVYLDAPLAAGVAARLRAGDPLDVALQGELGARRARVVRHAPLDVCDDAALRVAQVVTSLQQGGAERIAIDLAIGLPRRGVRSRLHAVYRPTRPTFGAPPGTLDLSGAPGDREARFDALALGLAAWGADLAHAHLLDAEDLARLSARGYRALVTVHNVAAGWPAGLERLGAESAALLVACARAVEAELAACALPIPVRTVWNGIELAPAGAGPAAHERSILERAVQNGRDAGPVGVEQAARGRSILERAVQNGRGAGPVEVEQAARGRSILERAVQNGRGAGPVEVEQAARGRSILERAVQNGCDAGPVEAEPAACGRSILERAVQNGRDAGPVEPAAHGRSILERAVQNGRDAGPVEAAHPSGSAGAVRTRTAEAAAWRRRLEIAPDDLVLLAVANPRPQKRLHLVPAILAATRAALAAAGDPRAARLVIAGSASPRSEQALAAEAEIQREVDRLGLRAEVRFAGAVADVAGLLAAADVLVSPSAHEGLSLAHLEALAAGLPVVATGAGGTAEIAAETPALVHLPLDAAPERFAGAIVAAARALPASPGGREVVARHFSAARMVEGYARLYPRAIARNRGPGRRDGLLLVTNNFSTGGAQSSARRLLLGLAAAGVRGRAAVIEEQPEYPTPGRRALAAAGIPVLAVPPPADIEPAEAVERLLRAIDEDPPEAVLMWNVIAEHKVLLADGLLDVPLFDISPGEMYFASLRRYFASPRPGLPYRAPRDYGARLAGVIVKYEAEAALAAEVLGAPAHVVPNGVALGARPPAARRASSDERARLAIGTAARIHPHKKLDELLAALRLAAPRLPPHVLRLAGGVDRGAEAHAEELRRMAAGLSVEWVGELADARAFLSDLDMFALIAEPAGCPNASLEAMAEGLPVVATAVGGMSEQVDDGVTGRLVPPADAAALAGALVELAADPALRARMGAAGWERARERFSLERMVRDYVDVCLGRRDGRGR